ncbi:MAG: glycoside hydrolase family 3 C-terminal domain-containing protein [Caldilineaceae bacterium]
MMGCVGGVAIADVLFGKVNPCGKLAETFPLKHRMCRPISTGPATWAVCATAKGLFIGYRYYDASRCRCLPVWLRAELHKLRVQQPAGIGHKFQGRRRRHRVCGCDQHGQHGGQGDRASVRPS